MAANSSQATGAGGRQEQPSRERWTLPSRGGFYASFGDDGLTATVNAYGDIMQFSKYIGKGYSGMFAADHRCVSEPYQVMSRTQDLLDLIDEDDCDVDVTYGPKFHDIYAYSRPDFSFVGDRWPRFHYKTNESGSQTFTVTWIVHGGILFQRCVVENGSDDDLKYGFRFAKNMLIRDLDHLYGTYTFNESTEDGYETIHGQEDSSWVRLHLLEKDQVTQDSANANVGPRVESDGEMVSRNYGM